MGHERGPKPFKQTTARTIFLRVPTAEWPAVKNGLKTEFRSGGGNVSSLWRVETPAPVVAYSHSPARGYDHQLMLLEHCWREKLMEIGPESLKREGYPDFKAFRRAWMAREKRRFTPMAEVFVYRLRPWEESDRREMADALLKRLYGDFL